MDDSKRHVVQFLEKEIKTYKALARFLAKKGIEEHVKIGSRRILISPAFYKDRMDEARGLVSEIRKSH
jgi:hypothetical protein